MANKKNEQRAGRLRPVHGVGAVLVLAGLAGLALAGYRWMQTVPLERIEVVGEQHADSTALMELAQVDTSLMLFDIDPEIVSDRVQRHPWVETAETIRIPTGTLRIAVRERTPVVLVLDGQGRPAHYYDPDGFAMPLTPEAVYDVPLLRGVREPYHPVRPVQDEPVGELLLALATLEEATDALVSELDIRPSGEIWLYTTPTGARGSIEVWLGRRDFAEKLPHLQAFWRQAVLTQPQKTFTVIDLRFDGQVVTREAERDS